MSEQPHRVVVGLGFGDEGKGATIDYLAREYDHMDVVRYNGGAQAAHHVQRADGHVHCFAQVGAAAMRPGRHTYLSRFVVVEPLGLEREFKALSAAGIVGCRERQHIDTRATMTTPYHRALNRIRECARAEGRHGSCGLGIGLAHLDRVLRRAPGVLIGDVLGGARHLQHRLEQVRLTMLDRAQQTLAEQPHPINEPQQRELGVLRDVQLSVDLVQRYEAILCAGGDMLDVDGAALTCALRERAVLFEGAQGVGLDPKAGFFPHVTATRTTPHQAWALLEEAGYTRDVFTLGVCRAYATRHGAGPFPSESEALSARIPDLHNAHGPWQGAWRVGWCDEVLLRHAIAQCEGLDAIAITCLDRLDGLDELHTITHYDARLTPEKPSQSTWCEYLASVTQTTSAHATWTRARDSRGSLCVPARAYVDALSRVAGLPVDHVATGACAAGRLRFDVDL